MVPVQPEQVLCRAEMLACACGPLLCRPELVLYRGAPPMWRQELRRVTPELLVWRAAAVIVIRETVVVQAEMPGARCARRAATPELPLCTRVCSPVQAETLVYARESRTVPRVSVVC